MPNGCRIRETRIGARTYGVGSSSSSAEGDHSSRRVATRVRATSESSPRTPCARRSSSAKEYLQTGHVLEPAVAHECRHS